LIEACRAIDVNRLHQTGCLVPGWSGVWQWTADGQRVGSVGLRVEAEHLILSYDYSTAGGAWQNVEETVPLVQLPCRFGGTRPYFRCPGSVSDCGRRVAKLYGPGRLFLCRVCYRLAYATQGIDEGKRALGKANRIRLRLGGEPGMLSLFPPKPKGMWWRTYCAPPPTRASCWAWVP
jgi:hypothetical protein